MKLFVFFFVFVFFNYLYSETKPGDPNQKDAGTQPPPQAGAAATDNKAPQPAADSGPAINMNEMSAGIKNDLQLVFFAGIGGAVLGLSTLSFVDKPSKNLKRVSMGFAIGAIAAAIFVLYKATSKSMSTGGGGISSTVNSAIRPQENQGQGEEPFPQQQYDQGQDYQDQGEGEDEYEEEPYSQTSMFYLANVKNGKFSLGLPLIDYSKDEKGYRVSANLLNIVF